MSDSNNNELLFINLAPVSAERNSNSMPAQSRKRYAPSADTPKVRPVKNRFIL